MSRLFDGNSRSLGEMMQVADSAVADYPPAPNVRAMRDVFILIAEKTK